MDFTELSSEVFFGLLPREQVVRRFDRLGQKKKALLQGIADRWAFDCFIEDKYFHITRSLNPKFIRSLQGYLLLSCGDALGTGAHFYSLKDFLDEHNSPERDKLASSYVNRKIEDDSQVIHIVKSIIGLYTRKQSVKQSFFAFWNNRSSTIKEKLFACYMPFRNNKVGFTEEKFSEITKKRLYESYRNPFTHAAQSNFPQVLPDMSNFCDPNLAKMVIRSEYHRADGKTFHFKVPLTLQEANKILGTDGAFYYRLIDNSLVSLPRPNKPEGLVSISISSRGGVPDKGKNGKLIYVHPGTLDVLRMALAEACAEMLGLPIDWNALYD